MAIYKIDIPEKLVPALDWAAAKSEKDAATYLQDLILGATYDYARQKIREEGATQIEADIKAAALDPESVKAEIAATERAKIG